MAASHLLWVFINRDSNQKLKHKLQKMEKLKHQKYNKKMDRVNSDQNMMCSDFQSRLELNIIITFLNFFQIKIGKNTNFEARLEKIHRSAQRLEKN